MDEERHHYKFLSFVNCTDLYSTQLFPQFLIESVMKTALDDDDFELKIRSTPFPNPAATKDKYFTSEELFESGMGGTILLMNEAVVYWSTQGVTANVILASTWMIINSYTLISVLRDRTSQRKHFQEYHG